MNLLSYLADAVVVLHGMYVAFVVVGLLAIVCGFVCKWRWVRNRWFRNIHLAMIMIVAIEALVGITCPLTTLENYLRRQAGSSVRDGTFVGQLVHDWLFYDAQPWVFTVAYSLFAVAVLMTWVFFPPSNSRDPLSLNATSNTSK